MLRHTSHCSALMGLPDLCTCGALVRALGFMAEALSLESANGPSAGAFAEWRLDAEDEAPARRLRRA